MGIYPNAYYNYRKHRKNADKLKKASALRTIKCIYHDCGGKPGYRMMQKILKNKGIKLSPQTVHKYMNVELKLKSVTRKKKYAHSPKVEPYAVYDNLLERNFYSKERNSKWCIDFTYLFFGKSKRYNCTIIDLYDRRVVASVNSNRINTQLAIKTLTTALESNNYPNGIILHSDRGCQFTSKEFSVFCKKQGVIQSMSKPGCPYDNAPMERYFNTLKAELIHLKTFADEATLYTEVNAYAYGWYNNLRPHSYNDGLPPAKVV